MRNLFAESDQLRNQEESEIPLTGDLPPTSELPPGMQRIRHGIDVVEKSISELNQPDQGFILGELVSHCQPPNERLPIDAESSSSSEPANNGRMDWALFSTEPRRMGENRHRFPPGSEFEFHETISDVIIGNGNFCNDTFDIRNVKRNASAHYVGQRSGPRNGRINAVPMLVKSGGISTYEYALICPGQIPKSECCEGDSGAWILTQNENKLVGLLWGWNDGQLVFSPIDEVFADIRKTFPARDVCLPHDPINREPPEIAISRNAVVSETVLTCAVKKRKNVKPYSLSTLLGPKPKSLRSKSRAKASIENEAVANQSTSPACETRDIAAPRGQKNLPPSSYDSSSSDPSLNLDIPYPVNDSSFTRIADTSSIGRSFAEKQSQPKSKMFKDFLHSQDRKFPMTDPDKDFIMLDLPKARPVNLKYVSHPKSQSLLWYIRLSVSTNHLTFPSESQALKPKYKFSGFLFSQMNAAAKPNDHNLKSCKSHVARGNLNDLSQSNLLCQKSYENTQANGSRSTLARRDGTNG